MFFVPIGAIFVCNVCLYCSYASKEWFRRLPIARSDSSEITHSLSRKCSTVILAVLSRNLSSDLWYQVSCARTLRPSASAFCAQSLPSQATQQLWWCAFFLPLLLLHWFITYFADSRWKFCVTFGSPYWPLLQTYGYRTMSQGRYSYIHAHRKSVLTSV